MMQITEFIPQREPFLFVENEFEILDNSIKTYYTFSKNNDFFQGHFPEQPVVPGVILCEHCFQSAAALIGTQGKTSGLAVVSRIQTAKFKNMVSIDEKINTQTILLERIENAAYFKSVVKNEDQKKVLLIEFACTLVSS